MKEIGVVEAVKIASTYMEYVGGKHGGFWVTSPTGLVSMLEQFGLIQIKELDEPNQLFFSAMGDVPMGHRDVGKILAIINALGLKLVEK